MEFSQVGEMPNLESGQVFSCEVYFWMGAFIQCVLMSIHVLESRPALDTLRIGRFHEWDDNILPQRIITCSEYDLSRNTEVRNFETTSSPVEKH